MSVSYEERLSSLVLKEEFFPLVDEMKDFIGMLTAAGKGILCYPGFLIDKAHSDCEQLYNSIKVYNWAFVSSFRAAGV